MSAGRRSRLANSSPGINPPPRPLVPGLLLFPLARNLAAARPVSQMLETPQSATFLTLLEIVGPIALLMALIYGTMHYRRQSRAMSRSHDAPPDQRGQATGWFCLPGLAS